MNHLQSYQTKLQTPAYDFLKTDPHLGENILILTLAGSIAYGTNLESSDLDLRGVTLETKTDLLGLSSFEQFEDRTTDTVIYGLKKFINLCLSNNPNVLEILGTAPEFCLILSPEGMLLKENVHLFLSKRVIQSFGNYASAQLRRLQNALARDNYPQNKKEAHLLNSIQSQMDHLKRSYQTFTNNEINLYLDQSTNPDFETEIFMDLQLQHYPLRDFKNIYSQMSNIIKDYSKLNHRNRKKDEPHLYKHAMHLIRLLITGTEILQGEGINIYREKEQELLLSIRLGKYTFEEIFAMVDHYEAEYYSAARTTVLPDEPDYQNIEKLMVEIYERFVNKK